MANEKTVSHRINGLFNPHKTPVWQDYHSFSIKSIIDQQIQLLT